MLSHSAFLISSGGQDRENLHDKRGRIDKVPMRLGVSFYCQMMRYALCYLRSSLRLLAPPNAVSITISSPRCSCKPLTNA